MHRLRTNTKKILPYNKLKTNFLWNKHKKLTRILKRSSPVQQNLKKKTISPPKKMLKNTYNKCSNKIYGKKYV